MFPTDLASFLELIRQHGPAAYSLIFGYASAHSLLLALFAGYAAHAGALSLGPLLVACFAGSLLGDVMRFWIGRRFGTALLDRFPALRRPAATVVRLAEKHYGWMILSHRYPHGIRGVAAIAYGMSKLGWPAFMLLNAVAAAIWAGAVVGAGYGFGHLSETVMQDASSKLGAIMLVAFLGLSWVLSRKLERVMELEGAGSDERAKVAAASSGRAQGAPAPARAKARSAARRRDHRRKGRR